MAQVGGGDWPATLALTNGELPADVCYTTIMARELDRDGNIAPAFRNASLTLLSWGGNACSFSGVPDAVVMKDHDDDHDPLYFAVEAKVVVGPSEEVLLDQGYAHPNATFRQGGYGAGGGFDQEYSVFSAASIRSVAPGQNVQSVDGQQVTTQVGDIEVTVRVGTLMGGSSFNVAHLMRPEQSNVATMTADAAGTRRFCEGGYQWA